MPNERNHFKETNIFSAYTGGFRYLSSHYLLNA